ncbi:hypothetical protein J6590_062984 [Homalodisca vitripennis]|nr:hypothetical protein J6590_062984 [Homalodisca vitripennis]
MAALEDLGRTEENNVPYLKQPKYRLRSLQDAIQVRVVLYLLSFSGFLISFMMRTDINISIVAIVKLPTPSTNQNSTQDSPLVCYDYSLNSTFLQNDDAPATLRFWLVEGVGSLTMATIEMFMSVLIMKLIRKPEKDRR